MATEADRFIALGPLNPGDAGFATHGTSIEIGGQFTGTNVGVIASSDTGTALRAWSGGGLIGVDVKGPPGPKGIGVQAGADIGAYFSGITAGVHAEGRTALLARGS